MGILFLALRISNNTNFEEKKELVKNFLYKNKIKQKFAFAQNLLLTNYKKINTKCLLHIINFVVIRYTVLIIRYNFFKKAGKIVGDLYTFLITRHLEKKFYKKINQNSMTGYQFNSDTKKIFFEYILYFIFYIHEKTLKLRKEYNTVKKSQQFSHKLYKEKEIWPEIGFINYQSNQIIHIGNIESIQKHGIYGTLNLDFRFYIKLKNKVLFPLVFSFFIKNFIRIFPAKIFKSCYYAKKAFFYFSKQINFFLFFKNIYLFLCWLEKQNWLNYYNIIFKKFYLF
ncbi:hypothetical protein CPARA_3gp363 (nucleomorph) [Cryptomonas paramecium]|uniref:Uncharacterized protein n=1 Tax=Cryptomonas paramaecium TaxID=2898 RepID=F2HI97_9CRYP|nr:hypothetical protein CPARA_3gp363 [Cryptomonas paramecium]AEA39021.1 hypothetical protein CPARA_3gp363 [Cryptomonas paramecium]